MRNAATVPAYGLYGERAEDRFPDGLHIETISARSAVHGWRIRPHRHRDLHQLFWFEAGGGHAELAEAIVSLTPGTALVVPPLVVHGFRFHPGTTGHVASIPARTLRRALGDDVALVGAVGRLGLLGPLDQPQRDAIKGLMERAHVDFSARHPGRDHALTAHAGLLLLWFLRTTGATAGPTTTEDRSGALVRRFLHRVETGFAGDRTLSTHAAALGVSVPHLTRVCRRILGRPALAVLHDRVLLEAKRNLVFTSMTISEVAFRLGFTDPAYFSRFFSTRVGCSPSDYRSTVFQPAEPGAMNGGTDLAPIGLFHPQPDDSDLPE